jgi:hypothetical protein
MVVFFVSALLDFVVSQELLLGNNKHKYSANVIVSPGNTSVSKEVKPKKRRGDDGGDT